MWRKHTPVISLVMSAAGQFFPRFNFDHAESGQMISQECAGLQSTTLKNSFLTSTKYVSKLVLHSEKPVWGSPKKPFQ